MYLLIIAGGIVRSTGAGMGCPDWPKCFGSWVPPTEVSQLPSDYQEIYGAKLKGEVEFNAVKTWIEYVNRLLGAFTGLLIFAVLVVSVPFLRSGHPKLFYASLAAFILVGFQGWLGSKVVSTELHPLMVTLHMVVAIVIVFVLLYILARSYSENLAAGKVQNAKRINTLILTVIGLSFVQIIIGTQVRESIDLVVARLGYASRNRWIEELGLEFYIHRSFSIILLIANILLYFWVNKFVSSFSPLSTLARWVLVVVGLEIAVGIILAYMGVPAFAQPIHLTLAVLLAGVQFIMWLSLDMNTKEQDHCRLVAELS
ncbi:cytochrome oxidase assembly protein [Persicitalea jodogahamensis]|uniref:Cytochrome oxidase assembly protein n=1 Tax=Persicitalea jodogahamensis TaxID=402147 RepID=A0A8J3G7F9_9BACT|nr:cytochrome oxidase assembly protein [Persicitalea jodogahamensis]